MNYVRIHVIPTANDDGSEGSPITKNDILLFIKYASDVYKNAGICFVFDPETDFDLIRRNTLLNQDQPEVPNANLNAPRDKNPGGEVNPCNDEKKRIADEYPGKLVIFFGKGKKYNYDEENGKWAYHGGPNWSSSKSNFVRMIEIDAATITHETGHYFQVRHTFGSTPEWPNKVPSGSKGPSASEYIRTYVDVEGNPKEKGTDVFDGDLKDHWYEDKPGDLLEPGITDTPADPGPNIFRNAKIDPCNLGHIHVFALGDDRKMRHSFWNGQKWSGWLADLGSRTFMSGPASAISSDFAIHVFAQGDDRNIWHCWMKNNNWSSWSSDLGVGTLTSAPSAVISPDSSRGDCHHVFALGDDRKMRHSFWNGQKWSGWQADLGSHTFMSGPAAVISSDFAIHVFALGDDRNIWHCWMKNNNWSSWSSDLGVGTLTSAPSVVISPYSSGGDYFHVFALGQDRKMRHSFWNGRKWSGWLADLGSRTFMSGPAAVITSDSAIHVFAQGDDRNIWHCWMKNNNWSSWSSDLGVGTLTSAPSVAAFGERLRIIVDLKDGPRDYYLKPELNVMSYWGCPCKDGRPYFSKQQIVLIRKTLEDVNLKGNKNHLISPRVLYDAIWEPSNPAQTSVLGLAQNDFAARFDKELALNRHVVHMQAYMAANGQLAWDGVWEPGDKGQTRSIGWAQNDFAKRFDAEIAKGRHVIHMQAYMAANGQLAWDGVWEPGDFSQTRALGLGHGDFTVRLDNQLANNKKIVRLQAYLRK